MLEHVIRPQRLLSLSTMSGFIGGACQTRESTENQARVIIEAMKDLGMHSNKFDR